MSGRTGSPGAGSHSNEERLRLQAADEEHTLASCCMACQPLPQTEIPFGTYHWSRDHLDATAPLGHTVFHTQRIGFDWSGVIGIHLLWKNK